MRGAYMYIALANLGLLLKSEQNWGEGKDGGGNMARKKSCVSSRHFKLNGKALYVHCFNQRLNHYQILQYYKEIYLQKLSIKGEQFIKGVEKLFYLDATKKKLTDVCLTRWVARTDGLVIF